MAATKVFTRLSFRAVYKDKKVKAIYKDQFTHGDVKKLVKSLLKKH